MYQFSYEGDALSEQRNDGKADVAAEVVWGESRMEINYWKMLRRLLNRMPERDRRLILSIARKMAGR